MTQFWVLKGYLSHMQIHLIHRSSPLLALHSNKSQNMHTACMCGAGVLTGENKVFTAQPCLGPTTPTSPSQVIKKKGFHKQ